MLGVVGYVGVHARELRSCKWSLSSLKPSKALSCHSAEAAVTRNGSSLRTRTEVPVVPADPGLGGGATVRPPTIMKRDPSFHLVLKDDGCF